MLLQMSLIMLADNRETSLPIFVFLKKNLNAPRPFSCFVWHISVHHGSGQARVFSMYPRRWLCLLGSRAKIYTRFVSDSAVHTYFGRAPLSLLTRQQKWYYRLQQGQSLILIGYTAVCTCWVLYFCIQHTRYCLKQNAVVHQPVLVEYYYYYCCFHLNYGTTTVDHDIIIRNKKRSLLCAPHPQWSEFKICESLAANNRKKHQSRACVQFWT